MGPRAKSATIALAVTMLLPACVAAAHATIAPDAAHDEAVVRALGAGWTGAWRALDVAWGGATAWLPIGTRAMRAALGGAATIAACAGILYALARRLLARSSGEEEGALAIAIAAIAASSATLGPPWQIEAQAALGATLGAALVLAPVAVLALGESLQDARVVAAAFALGAALSYEPLVFASALAACGAYLALSPIHETRAAFAGRRATSAAAFVLGLAPMGIALARNAARAPILATGAALFASAAGERGESGGGLLLVLARDEVGVASCVVALAGAVLAWRVAAARATAAAMTALAVMGGLAMACGAPCGPTRYAPSVLAAIGAAYVLAAVAMQAVVLAVSRAPIPMARASAALLVVLEATFPARAADDAETRADLRPRGAATAWTDAATSALPAGAVVLVREPRVLARLLAARASGDLRADLAIIPLFDLGGRLAMRALARDAKLQPLWRDAALLGDTSEWSLSQLAASRPLVAPYDPKWDRALARHLVPAGLFARFEPEPRGASDRRRALDDFAPTRERLAHAIDGDPELVTVTSALLRARAVALAATSERDLVARALDDLRPFAPRDPVALELVKRAASHHGGPIDVTGLVP